MTFDYLRNKLNEATRKTCNRFGFNKLEKILTSDIPMPKLPKNAFLAGVLTSSLLSPIGCGSSGGGGDAPDTRPKILCNVDDFGQSNFYVYTMTQDGTLLTQCGTSLFTGKKPKYNPVDRTKIIASRKNGSGYYYIFSANIDGTNEAPLINENTYHSYKASYNPDATKFAYITNPSGPKEVWITDADGTNRQKLVGQSADDKENPVWGADGYIYYQAWKTNNWEVCRTKADGTEAEQNLTNDPTDDVLPDISHDGTKLVISSDRNLGIQQLFIGNPDGTGLSQITTLTSSHAVEPNFSPDGNRIVYSEWTASPETSDLVVITNDGLNEEVITDGAKLYYSADW